VKPSGRRRSGKNNSNRFESSVGKKSANVSETRIGYGRPWRRRAPRPPTKSGSEARSSRPSNASATSVVPANAKRPLKRAGCPPLARPGRKSVAH
jgi:hypothetical protein